MWVDLKLLVSKPSVLFTQLQRVPKVKGALFIVFILSFIQMFVGGYYVENSLFSEVGLDELGGIWLSIIPISFGSLFGSLVYITVMSFIFLIITKLAKSRATYTQLFSMYTYIAIITTFGGVLNTIIQALIGGNGLIEVTSIGYWFGSDLSSPLQLLDVFFIWELILMAIGLIYTAGLKKQWAWMVVSVYFLLLLIVAVI